MTMAEKLLNNTNVLNIDNIGKTIAQTTFICIVTFLGLFGNCLVIGCILKNRVERCKASNLLSLNLCVVNIIDCVVNMTFIISSSTAQSWDHSDTVCSLHASTVQMVNIEVILGIMAITLDRLIFSKRCDTYLYILTPWKTVALIVYTWIQSLGFAIPITFGFIPSIYYQSKYFCTMDRNVSLVYTIFVCVSCFVIPIFTVIGSYIFILRMVVLMKTKRTNTQIDFYSEINTTASNSSKELNQSRFSLTVFTLWLFFHGPFIVANFYEQFINSNIVDDLALYKLPAEIDFIFSWARFSFPAAFAIFSLCHKGFRISLKRLISCRKNNSVVDLNSASKVRHSGKNSKARLQLSAMKLKEKYSGNSKDLPLTPTTFQVPVLFATSKGIHMQKLQNDLSVTKTDMCYVSQPEEFALHGAEKCDVLGSQCDLIQVEDDTSDYDSSGEVDRFSVSHPISYKMAKEIKSDTVHVIPRSMSNPEVGGGNHPADKPKRRSERSIVAGDSGIDISSTGVNSMSRKSGSSVLKTSCVPEVETLTEISLPSTVNSISSVVFTQAADCLSRNSVTPKNHRTNQCIIQLCDRSTRNFDNKTKDTHNSKDINSNVSVEHETRTTDSDSHKPIPGKLVKNQNKSCEIKDILAFDLNDMITPTSRLKPIDHVLKSQRHKKSKHTENMALYPKNRKSVEHFLDKNINAPGENSVLQIQTLEHQYDKTSSPTDIHVFYNRLELQQEMEFESDMPCSPKDNSYDNGNCRCLKSELSKNNPSGIKESKKILRTVSSQNRLLEKGLKR